jgi:hypothetical protein
LPPRPASGSSWTSAPACPPPTTRLYRQILDEGKSDVWTRGKDEFAGLFEGLELVEPGVVPASEWRPEPGSTVPPRSDINLWTATARKL